MIEQALTNVRLYLPQAKPFAPHAAALLFVALLGWANGYFQASKEVENPDLKDTWAVPAWAPYHAGPERTLFSQIDIWDGVKRQAAPAPASVKQAWQFVGTVRQGEVFAAMILIGDTGRIRRATPGDTLPNGEKIVAVEKGLLQLEVSGNQQEIKLFEPVKK